MKYGERFDIGHLRQFYPFFPRRMAPTNFGRKFRFGVGRIIDHQIRTIDQVENIFVRLAGYMLRIGDIADRLALEFDAVSGGAVGMIEHRRTDADFIVDLKRLPSVEIDEAQFGFQRLNWHGKHRIGHLPRYHLVEAALRFEVPGHERVLMLGMKRRSKERKACYVIPVRMGKQQSCLGDAFFEIPVAKIADPGSGIENDLLTASIHFQATCIAAKGDVVRRRAGDAAANAPKFELKTH